MAGNHIRDLHLAYAAVYQQLYLGILLHHDVRSRILFHDLTGLFVRVVSFGDCKLKISILLIGDHIVIQLPHQFGHLDQIVALFGAVVPII